MAVVGFWFDTPVGYTGGVNYIRNLLYAIHQVGDERVRPVIFFSADIPGDLEEDFARYATVVRTRLIQRKTVPWFIHKVLFRLFGVMPFATRLLRAHGVQVVSHAWFAWRRPPVPIVSWIPDFQYLHLPEFFPGMNPAVETSANLRIIRHSTLVILSSHAALEDYLRIAPAERAKARVLPFVSQPGRIVGEQLPTRAHLETKYGFSGPFFFLPNQFWAHKNHGVVVDAVGRLRDRGLDVQLVCTGNTRDYRRPTNDYLDSLRAVITSKGLDKHVHILGLIEYGDVLALFRHATAVLNPSKFEGWSSSVEEAKSIGKPVILSRIPVHVEQDPRPGFYFDPDDAEQLARVMETIWSQTPPDAEAAVERASRDLESRTVAYGREYLAIVEEALRAGR
jgi:glycosyltransferase involved in cell wall biosynthesis